MTYAASAYPPSSDENELEWFPGKRGGEGERWDDAWDIALHFFTREIRLAERSGRSISS